MIARRWTPIYWGAHNFKEALGRDTRRFGLRRAAISATKLCDIAGLVVNHRRAKLIVAALPP
jgi:hypothetical protein